MAGRYGPGGISPNRGGAETCTDSAVSCTISDLIRSKYPVKTWSFISQMFGLQERTAKHRLAGTRAYTISELTELLRSDDGADILEALMADAKPRWWAGVEAAMKIATARYHQEMARQVVMMLDAAPLDMPARKKLKRVTDADRSLSAARAKEEAVLGFLLQDGNCAVAGAVAAPKAQAGGAGVRRR